MYCSAAVSKVHQDLSIPDLIKLVRHTFRQCEFDDVQNSLMERENQMKLEIEEHAKDRDSLKKEIDLMEKSRSFMEFQKCEAEKKLGMSKRRCDESDKVIAQMEEEIRVLKNEKFIVEEKLECSNRKCNEMDGRLLNMGAKLKRCEDLENEKMVVEEKLQCSDRNCEEMLREIEELRREKIDANKTIVDLKQKEIEANQTVQELKLKNGEDSQTIDELRSKVVDLHGSISRIENGLSKMLSVDTEDLPNLVKGMDACADSKENENGEDFAGSLGVGLSQKGGITMAHPRSVPVAAEKVGTVKDNEGQEPGVKGPKGKTQAAGVVIVLSDSDDEEDAVDAIPGKSSGQTSKRNITECIEDSLITSTAKKGRSTFAQPSRCSLLSSRVEEGAGGAACDSEDPPLISSFTVKYEDCVDSDTETYLDTDNDQPRCNIL